MQWVGMHITTSIAIRKLEVPHVIKTLSNKTLVPSSSNNDHVKIIIVGTVLVPKST